ncbi:MAG: HEPN domain-containing protein [Verrucomicrobia bacterium]|nr:HEPN domain-containing protein [Verrucomicrobiota bacterium]
MSRASDLQAWLDKAQEDWLCVRNEMAAAQTPWAVVSFHAQQAAEKTLKALLVVHGQFPPRVHDLARLLDLCLQFEPGLETVRDDCEHLSQCAVDVRYPDVGLTIEATIGRDAVAAAERICDAIRPLLVTK